MKTLTDIALTKIMLMFSESVSHAVYTLDGVEYEIDIFRRKITQDTVRIFVYLNDSVEGDITEVRLIDRDGDVVAKAAREFIKPYYKGLYSIFKYRFVEVEDDYTNA